MVRKSLSGLRFDSMLAGNCQLGEKRMACDPAIMRNRKPIRIMTVMMNQSRKPRLLGFIVVLMDRQPDMNGGAREGGFIEAGTLEPDATAM